MTQDLRAAIEKKYIGRTRRPATDLVGVELELPIVNLNRGAVDFALVHRLTERFAVRFGFTELHHDDEGHIFSATSPENRDNLSYDCSYHTLELSFGAEHDLHTISRRFEAYYAYIQDVLLADGHTLTGMGINPDWKIHSLDPVPNGRYRMLLHYLSSYRKMQGTLDFHSFPNYGFFSCASQVQLDIDEAHICEALRTFARLEPFKSLLFANSPFHAGQDSFLLARDWLWAKSMHGLNPKNVGFYDGVTSVQALVDYIGETSIFCTERDGHYLSFAPVPVWEYMQADSMQGEYYADGSYHTMTFRPALSDLAYLRSYKLEDLTYRGTIEFRSVCEQPVSEVLASAAFHAGLLRKLSELTALLDADDTLYGSERSAAGLRDMLNRGILPGGFSDAAVSTQLLRIVDLAADGLAERGFGEKVFLTPLYDRARRLASPARDMLDGLRAGKTEEDFIRQYASLA